MNKITYEYEIIAEPLGYIHDTPPTLIWNPREHEWECDDALAENTMMDSREVADSELTWIENATDSTNGLLRYGLRVWRNEWDSDDDGEFIDHGSIETIEWRTVNA